MSGNNQATSQETQDAMKELIERLQAIYDQLDEESMNFARPLSEHTAILHRMAKLNSDILHYRMLAAFDPLTTPVIDPPTAAEVQFIRGVLTRLGQGIDQEAAAKELIATVESLMTDTAVAVAELMETIS
jgi:glucose-6-phosphate dehydrogenase assembly protein OpcA